MTFEFFPALRTVSAPSGSQYTTNGSKEIVLELSLKNVTEELYLSYRRKKNILWLQRYVGFAAEDLRGGWFVLVYVQYIDYNV